MQHPRSARFLTRRHRRADTWASKGFSLVELLVAIVIFAVIGAIVLGIFVAMNRGSRSTTSAVMTESQMVDAMTRIGRDIGSSNTVSSATASQIDLIGHVNGQCVEHFYSAIGSTLSSKSITHKTAGCQSGAQSTVTNNVVSGLSSTNIFSYFDNANNPITPAQATLSSIRRIAYTVSAKTIGRTNNLVLTSSGTLLSGSAPDGTTPGTNSNSSCSAPNWTQPASNPYKAQTTSVALAWTQPINATGYVLQRDGQSIYQPNSPTATSYTDTVQWGGTYLYYVYAVCDSGSSGPTLSPPSTGMVVTVKPAAPSLTCSTTQGVQNVVLNWPAGSNGAAGYKVYNEQGSATAYTSTDVGNVKTDTVNAPWDTPEKWYVTAYNDAGESGASNIVTCHPTPPSAAGLTPTITVSSVYTPDRTYWSGKDNTCTVSWSLPASQIAEYGISEWQLQANFDGYGWQNYTTYAVGTTSINVPNGDGSWCADGSQVQWKVRAINSVSQSQYSNPGVYNLPPGPILLTPYESQASYDSSHLANEIATYSGGDGAGAFYSNLNNTGWQSFTGQILNEQPSANQSLALEAVSAYGASNPAGNGSSVWKSSPRMPSTVNIATQCNGGQQRLVITPSFGSSTGTTLWMYITNPDGSSQWVGMSNGQSWTTNIYAVNQWFWFNFHMTDAHNPYNPNSMTSQQLGQQYSTAGGSCPNHSWTSQRPMQTKYIGALGDPGLTMGFTSNGSTYYWN